MSKKNPLIQFAGHFQSVATEISEELKERGINVVEAITAVAQPRGKPAIKKIADVLAELVHGVVKNILEIPAHLSLADRIARGKYDWVNP
ncbi:MAG: hypothetical protein AAB631_03275, partial [Patescibacteria group bacterium]